MPSANYYDRTRRRRRATGISFEFCRARGGSLGSVTKEPDERAGRVELSGEATGAAEEEEQGPVWLEDKNEKLMFSVFGTSAAKIGDRV
jgi:hypothetical protein